MRTSTSKESHLKEISTTEPSLQEISTEEENNLQEISTIEPQHEEISTLKEQRRGENLKRRHAATRPHQSGGTRETSTSGQETSWNRLTGLTGRGESDLEV